MSHCPSTTVLEAFAAGSCADESVGAHVGECSACRAAVEEAREDLKFLAGVRTALAAHAAAGSAPPDPVLPAGEPDLVSGYQVQEEIHRGGQGVVYRAVQTRTNRLVAIKMLLGGQGASGRQRERFEREIRIAAALRHPNIVTVHDSGYISDGRYGLVMEFIEGVPLDRWSRSLEGARGRDARRLALRKRLGVMVKVCDAVLYAHQHSIVHRDLKPANILVDAAGEPHILDFGIARDTGPEQHTRLTNTGEFAGTLAYASPEQVAGDPSKVDTRTDIYSLGVIMYEMVSGKMPYAVDGPMSQIIRGIESEEPLPLPRHTRSPDGPWVDGEVSTIVLKAMAKDPARRYQTAAGLRNDIERYLAGEAIEARRDSTWYILRKTAARHRVFVTAAGLIFILLAAFGGAMTWQARRLEIRGAELARALSDSNIARGRTLAGAGSLSLAEEVVWPELIGAGVDRVRGPDAGFAGSPQALHAYWALWDIFQRSSCVATLRGLDSESELLYFDQDGARLNAVDPKGHLVSWSVPGWETSRNSSLVAATDAAISPRVHAAAAPDGSIAIFGGGLLRVVNSQSGQTVVQADNGKGRAFTGVYSPDGAVLATVGTDHKLRLWDGRSLGSIAEIAEPVLLYGDPWISRPAFSSDGRLVAAARPDGSIGLWNTASGALERTLTPPTSLASEIRDGLIICSVAFGPGESFAASLNAHIVVWRADGQPARDLGAPFGLVRSVAFLPGSEGRMLVSSGSTPGGGNGASIIWNLETGEQAATFRHQDESFACAASPDGGLIAVGCESGAVRVFEAARDPHVTVLRAARGASTNAALSADGRTLAVTDSSDDRESQRVLLIDLPSRVQTGRIDCGVWLEGLAFAPDGSFLLGCLADGRTLEWDLPSGEVRREFSFPDYGGHARPTGPPQHYTLGGFNQMRLSADGVTLARARDDGLVGLWDARTGVWSGWLDDGSPLTAAISFSPDGASLAVQHPGSCTVWDMRTRNAARTIITDPVYPTVQFSPDSKVIVHSAPSGLQWLDVRTGKALHENHDPQSDGLAMVFHPGGSVLIASAFDSSVRLWDVRSGRELLSLRRHDALIRSLVLTPDARTLISTDDSGAVIAWDLGYFAGRIARELAVQTSPR